MSTHMDNILDVEPRAMSFHFVRDTTNDFSEEQVIGQGGYGIVYKGVDRDGPVIAVRKLYPIREIDDEQLQKEFTGLKMLNHPNIVRLLAYCYEQEQLLIPYKEKHIFAPRTIRVLCFEYMKNGSLDQYIEDASSGLSWHGRYQIIKGISEGLRYLHEGLKTPIIHMNLKPSNILLDHNMIPKIADFGLRRLVGEGNARCMGTIAYMSPEFIERQIISHKCDIYSLGVIIIKLITGERLYSGHFDMSSDRFIELAHEEWRERLQKTLNGMSLEGYSQQIKKCLEIAFKCVELDRHERPSIGDIIDRLNETETLIPEEVRAVHTRIDSTHSELLEVHPQELYFPFMLKGRCEAMSSCSLQLKNRGDNRVAFMLVASNPDRYLTRKPLCGIVPPRCVYTLSLTMLQQTASTSSSDSSDFFTLYTTAVGQHDLLDVPKDVVSVEYDYFFKKVQKMPGARDKVQVATLKVICDRRPATKSIGRSSSPEGGLPKQKCFYEFLNTQVKDFSAYMRGVQAFNYVLRCIRGFLNNL
ncbi:cysteine-rich receptor-like protein kinase 44 isoform X3 [Aegilops tauschii subsp. strangulata]|uniref:Protein kinase domain-containing protein n=3 Tax=Aegilops tauschii subsp. strangulata TaxID=200361 RepID=A0A453E0D1_AEGTS|nr:putative receptor-like protein kinase At4g00960 isoform X3 [Aegilops tauschii subsp. strangulata]